MGNRSTCCGRMCPKVAGYGAEHDLFDDPHSCDPAGAIFRETLEDLNEIDRLLLLFCSSSNLAAVRWLFILGASQEASDTNGTTCLHAACRSGSLGVVRDLITHGLPVNTGDVAGWTALHIAAFMGRRSVAIELMQSGADLKVRSHKGLAPADLCSDGWLREAIYACAVHRERSQDNTKWRFGGEHDLVEDAQVSSRLRFEPFFVPRAPTLRDPVRVPALQRLGTLIFNQRPGQGLAFLVATGAVRDFPIELSTFLLENKVSRAQVGEFLGEDFSLSQTLRLEFINSVRLTGTGVVSCLAKVFKQVHTPSDMQKIDRLLEGVAQIWWRQHERLQDYPQHIAGDKDPDDDGEYEGLRLMKLLANYGALHQLMFSTVLLHWSVYAPLPPSQRVTQAQWLEMNAGFGGKDGVEASVVQRMQRLIFNAINRALLPQLQIWSTPPPDSIEARKGRLPSAPGFGARAVPVIEEGDIFVANENHDEEAMEGWGRLVGGGFPSAAGAGSLGSTVTYRHLRSIHCETTSTKWSTASPVNSRPHMDAGYPAPVGSGTVPASVAFTFAAAGVGKETDVSNDRSNGADRVWLVLRNSLLFFAAKPHGWAPYAFVYLVHMIIRSVDPQTCTITLACSVQNQAGMLKDRADEALGYSLQRATHGTGDNTTPPVQVVFLLPDGRWQALEVPQLEVQLNDLEQLERWQQSFSAYCGSAEAISPAWRVSAKGSTSV